MNKFQTIGTTISTGGMDNPIGHSFNTIFGQLLHRNELEFDDLWDGIAKGKRRHHNVNYRTVRILTGWNKEIIDFGCKDTFPLFGRGSVDSRNFHR